MSYIACGVLGNMEAMIFADNELKLARQVTFNRPRAFTLLK